VRLSICEFTTLGASFEEDLAAYSAAGVEGIGVCEVKLVEGAAERLRESGLRATHCVPAVPSILPLPLMEGPTEPQERVAALCASVARFAELELICVLFPTGPAGGRDDARAVVREGIRAVAAAGARAGVRVALEPIHPTQTDVFSFVHTIPDALELIGAEDVGILLDTWHVSDPGGIAPYVDRVVGVHVADRREPTRSHFDRVLPGDGVLDLAAVLRTLQAGRYDGWYDVEIFSDNGLRRRLPRLPLGPRSLRARPPRARKRRACLGGALMAFRVMPGDIPRTCLPVGRAVTACAPPTRVAGGPSGHVWGLSPDVAG
jgi:sugar phosphate isomerase/epimerase